MDSPEETTTNPAKEYLKTYIRKMWENGELVITDHDRAEIETKIDESLKNRGSSFERPTFELGTLDGDKLVFSDSCVSVFAGTSTSLKFRLNNVLRTCRTHMEAEKNYYSISGASKVKEENEDICPQKEACGFFDTSATQLLSEASLHRSFPNSIRIGSQPHEIK